MEKNLIKFSGAMLQPGFSIYIMEVTIEGVYQEDDKTLETWHYIGMTGDNYYPSARSGFHRISGHLQLGENTQNQLYQGIVGLVGDGFYITGEYPDKTWDDVMISMTKHEIPGYDALRWHNFRNQVGTYSQETMQALRLPGSPSNPAYLNFLTKRNEVLAMEKELIHRANLARINRVFNKPCRTTRALDTFSDEMQEIAGKVCEKLKIEW